MLGPFRLRRPRSSATVLSVAGAALLVAILLLQVTEGSTPLLTVGPVQWAALPLGEVQATVAVTSHRPWPIPVSAALLPLRLLPGERTVCVFEDAGYPSLFGTTLEVAAFVQQLSAEFRTLGSSTEVTTVDAAGLPSFLSGNTSATLAVINYGTVPASVLSNQSDLLGRWLHAGGQLLWAGGALGYYQGPDPYGPAGTLPGSMGWAGEMALLGFPLLDPVAAGPQGPEAGPLVPLLGSTPAPLASAFGVSFNATVYGANTTQLADHGGVDLGFDSAAVAGGPAPRTSIAYLPVGAGSLLLFGGAVLNPAQQYIPEGGVRLTQDASVLLAFPFVPLAGPIATSALTLGPFADDQLRLGSTGPLASPAVVLRCVLAGALLVERVAPMGP